MKRVQIFLDDAMHARLRALARGRRRSLSSLVRDAIESVYGELREDDRERSLRTIAGLWKNRSDLPSTDADVRRLRRNTRSTRHRSS